MIIAWLVAGLLLLGLLSLLPIRQFLKTRKLYGAVATQTGLSLSYANPKDFAFTGAYREYEATVISTSITKSDGTQVPAFKASLGMINPQGKMLLIWKGPNYYQEYLPKTQQIPLKDTFQAPVSAISNDLMFSSYLLSDPIKAGIVRTLGKGFEGGLFLSRDSLSLISIPAGTPADIIPMLDLLADMKDSLRTN